jgi:hypothetical protein
MFTARKKRRERLPVRVLGHPQTIALSRIPFPSIRESYPQTCHQTAFYEPRFNGIHPHLPPEASKRWRKIWGTDISVCVDVIQGTGDVTGWASGWVAGYGMMGGPPSPRR